MFNILVYGLSVAVCGMATVFAALVILIGLVKALEKCVSGEALAFVKEKVGAKVQARFRSEVSAPVAAPAAQAENNDELVAVITAAVAAMLEAEAAAGGAAVEEAPKGFVVRSIRRISNAPAWNRAGREEQVYSRM
ncbi:MAG: OadG family protein [Clostridia bacterium]|nr:OadG family protein [Clostridia bacterium]